MAPGVRPDAGERAVHLVLAILGFGCIGLYFLIAGDGPARLVGLLLLGLAGLFAYMLWVAVAVERPERTGAIHVIEVRHG